MTIPNGPRFRVTKSYGPLAYTVEHLVRENGRDTPTPTAHTFASEPDALQDALGRAAKRSILSSCPVTVEYHDGRKWAVTVALVEGSK